MWWIVDCFANENLLHSSEQFPYVIHSLIFCLISNGHVAKLLISERLYASLEKQSLEAGMWIVYVVQRLQKGMVTVPHSLVLTWAFVKCLLQLLMSSFSVGHVSFTNVVNTCGVFIVLCTLCIFGSDFAMRNFSTRRFLDI